MSQLFFIIICFFVFVINIRNEEVIKQLGRRIIVLRFERGLSQEQLANIADIPLAQVGRIERGKINCTISTLRAISIALNIHLKDLFNFDYKY